jgi:hypothetical protein
MSDLDKLRAAYEAAPLSVRAQDYIAALETENATLRQAVQDLLSAYDEYMDTDVLDSLAEAVGRLRGCLS